MSLKTVWKFDLEDGSHEVDFRFNPTSNRETLFVDDIVVSRAIRWIWTLKSRHPFLLGNHRCEVIAFDDRCELRIDGQPVEMLPQFSLLRPAQPTMKSEELLRPVSGGESGSSPAAELLRPGMCDRDTR